MPNTVDNGEAEEGTKVTMEADVEGTLGHTWIYLGSTHMPPSVTPSQVAFRNIMISFIFQGQHWDAQHR